MCVTLSHEDDLIVGDSNGNVHILNVTTDTPSINNIDNAHAVRYLLTYTTFSTEKRKGCVVHT